MQTYEDYPSWRHARKLKMFPEDTLLVATHNADSTREEAQYFLRFVRQEGFKVEAQGRQQDIFLRIQ